MGFKEQGVWYFCVSSGVPDSHRPQLRNVWTTAAAMSTATLFGAAAGQAPQNPQVPQDPQCPPLIESGVIIQFGSRDGR